MPIVTISRQLGSLGTEIGKIAAERLSYKLVWRDLINESARRTGAPETALAVIDDLGLFGIKLTKQESQAYGAAVQQVMAELAEGGNVIIIGRAGQVILKDEPDALHVRVYAPAGLRAERLAAKQGISLASAAAQVKTSDQRRRKYLKRYYGINWQNPKHYDLMLNTARLTAGQGADLVVQAVLNIPVKA